MQDLAGVGCDIEETDRFCLDRIRDATFLKTIFFPSELDYCFSFDAPAPHLAARFCAKEAVVKALGSLGKKPVAFGCIEIGKHPSGAPFVTIHAGDHDTRDQEYEIRLSMSHSRTTAMAVAIISTHSSQNSPRPAHPAEQHGETENR